MPIANPTPISLVADELWVTQFQWLPGRIEATAAPYKDGYLIGGYKNQRRVKVDLTADAAGKAVCDAAVAEVARVSGWPVAEIGSLLVHAHDPDMSVLLTVVPAVEGRDVFQVGNLFAALAADAELAASYAAVMAWLAAKLGG